MKTWVKLYTEMLNDPKMAALTLAEAGLWCLLIALAGQVDGRNEDDEPTGALGSRADVAWCLRRDLAELDPMIDHLVECGLLSNHDGQVTVINYAKRQAIPQSSKHDSVSERQRQWYAKQKPNATITPLGTDPNATITEPEQNREDKNRVEVEAEQTANAVRTGSTPATTPTTTPARKSPKDTAGVAAVHLAWQNARGGAVNAMDAEQLTAMCDEYGADWVEAAIHDANAARQDKLLSLNYVRAFLKRWKREGFRAPFDAQAQRAESQAAQSRVDAAAQADELRAKSQAWLEQESARIEALNAEREKRDRERESAKPTNRIQ